MLKVYLSGEIHSDWRDQITRTANNMEVGASGPVTDHDASDDCGVSIMGAERMSSGMTTGATNAIRTRKGIEDADIVVVRFGKKPQ